MEIHLSARHIKTTPAIYSYVATKIGHLEDYVDNIIAAHVVLWLDESHGGKEKRFVVKAHLSLPGPDVFGEEHDPDLYAAIDKITDKLARQLAKRKTKILNRRRGKVRKEKERLRNSGKIVV